MSYRKAFIVEPQSKVRLDKIDPAATDKHETHDAAQAGIAHNLERLRRAAVSALRRRKPLAARHLAGHGRFRQRRHHPAHLQRGTNPQGTEVKARIFKEPTPEELAHDSCGASIGGTPGKGELVIFNRSHYEDVLVARVHNWCRKTFGRSATSKSTNSRDALAKRHRGLSNSTCTSRRKCSSPASSTARRSGAQLEDQRERLCRPRILASIHRGLRGSDLADQHRARALVCHSVQTAGFRNLAVSQIIADTMDDMKLKLPPARANIQEIRRKYHAAEKEDFPGQHPSG